MASLFNKIINAITGKDKRSKPEPDQQANTDAPPETDTQLYERLKKDFDQIAKESEKNVAEKFKTSEKERKSNKKDMKTSPSTSSLASNASSRSSVDSISSIDSDVLSIASRPSLDFNQPDSFVPGINVGEDSVELDFFGGQEPRDAPPLFSPNWHNPDTYAAVKEASAIKAQVSDKNNSSSEVAPREVSPDDKSKEEPLREEDFLRDGDETYVEVGPENENNQENSLPKGIPRNQTLSPLSNRSVEASVEPKISTDLAAINSDRGQDAPAAAPKPQSRSAGR